MLLIDSHAQLGRKIAEELESRLVVGFLQHVDENVLVISICGQRKLALDAKLAELVYLATELSV